MAVAVGGGKVRVGRSRFWGGRVYQTEPLREQDGGNYFLDTTDSRLRQQYRAACAFEYTRSSSKTVFHIDSGLPFDTSSDPVGGRGLTLTVGGGEVRVGSG